MVAVTPDLRRARTAAVAAGEAFLRVYAQILFSRSPAVGLVMLAATATVPRAFVAGAGAVLAATALATLLDFDPDAVARGDYGYGALLVGLGVGQVFGASTPAMVLLVAGAAASVLVTAAARAWLGGTANLPVLSLPFLAAFQLVLGVAAAAGAAPGSHLGDPSSLAAVLPSGLVLFLRSLGGIFFLPRLDAGALVFAALLLHSRIAASLAASAFTAVLVLASLLTALPEGASVEVLGESAMLTAVALGGVYFVPSLSSFLLALLGASVSTLAAVALAGPFARLGVPLLIFPFNATVLLTLFALRQRARDLRPKSVDFLSGTPEENLAYFHTRRSRFQQLYPVAFQLPVRGAWTCTQATDGAFTHQGPWRHAFDFEVRDDEGGFCRAPGLANDDFHCFRLPVLAAADGTVVAVESGVPDNAVGALDVQRNWGNHVLVHHAIGVYSLVAHLARGSVKVQPGQPVRRGDVLGLCGSSGRSPRPHLHFHLQGTPVLGAPTLPCRFTDVVVEPSSPASAVIDTALLPQEGMRLRNLEPGAEVLDFLRLEAGRRLCFRSGGAVERLEVDVDLYGRRLLRSRDRQATLFYGQSDAFFTAYDALGEKGSVLALIRAALPRVPLEANEALTWTDHLPARHFRPWLGRVLFDLLSPFLSRDGFEMELRLRRRGASLVIEGASKRRDRRGTPVVRTRAELSRGVGPTRV
jgi:murein DD-endopeptidase MepM/ murein hydrolase activator NlpD